MGSSFLCASVSLVVPSRAALRCGARASRRGGVSRRGAQALGARASVVLVLGLSSCGARAWLRHRMWTLPGPGIKPVSPALADGFLTSGPPGKPITSVVFFSPQNMCFLQYETWSFLPLPVCVPFSLLEYLCQHSLPVLVPSSECVSQLRPKPVCLISVLASVMWTSYDVILHLQVEGRGHIQLIFTFPVSSTVPEM